jgi:heme/copper-type cytochrome/quinol oxidase subunit 2
MIVVRLKNIKRQRIEEMAGKVTEKSGINIRALASVALLCAGVWLVPSGIALHLASHDGATKWSHLFMTIHNTASFLFLIVAVVHVIMNWKALTHYVNAKVGEYMRFKRELLIAVLGVSAFVMLVAFHAFPVP